KGKITMHSNGSLGFASSEGVRMNAPCSPAVRGGLCRRADLCLFDITELSHAWISDRAPGVDRPRRHWESARFSRVHFGELLHSEAVLERHAVGLQEIEEHTG